VGAELARAGGAKVVCLGQGSAVLRDDFRFKHDEIRYYSRSAIVPKMATDPITWRPDERHTARILRGAVGPLAPTSRCTSRRRSGRRIYPLGRRVVAAA
jgi:gluconate 2-dehydrogenase alpha chain